MYDEVFGCIQWLSFIFTLFFAPQLIGMALESRRLDVFSNTIREVGRRHRKMTSPTSPPGGVSSPQQLQQSTCTSSLELLSYAMSICLKFIDNRQWRDMVRKNMIHLTCLVIRVSTPLICEFHNSYSCKPDIV